MIFSIRLSLLPFRPRTKLLFNQKDQKQKKYWLRQSQISNFKSQNLMNIFVVNSGSSSIKYQLFKMPNEKPICTGLVERIGLENSVITHKLFLNGEEKLIRRQLDLTDHEAGLHEVAQLLTDPE